MAQPDFTIKKGDTRPAIQATLSSVPTDVLSSVVFNMKKKDGTAVVTRGTGTIVQQPSATLAAIVKYQWQAADTSAAGTGFQGEFEVTYSDSRVESFPNGRNLLIEIIEDLG